jgi:hypothetical protein
MGKGIDLARDLSPVHTAVLDDLKDQLLIVFLKRIARMQGERTNPNRVSFSLAEIDNTGNDLLSFQVDPITKDFHFELSKKS